MIEQKQVFIYVFVMVETYIRIGLGTSSQLLRREAAAPAQPATPAPTEASLPSGGVQVLDGGNGNNPSSTCVQWNMQTMVLDKFIAAQCCDSDGTCRRYVGSDDATGCIAGVSPAITATTYSQAVEKCIEKGLVLCEKSCYGQGCGYDQQPVWTKKPCEDACTYSYKDTSKTCAGTHIKKYVTAYPDHSNNIYLWPNSQWTLQGCKTLCDSEASCMAIAYNQDLGDAGTTPRECVLYNSCLTRNAGSNSIYQKSCGTPWPVNRFRGRCVAWDTLPQDQKYTFTTQQQCQRQAISNGHTFYEYGGESVSVQKCATMMDCTSSVADSSTTIYQSGIPTNGLVFSIRASQSSSNVIVDSVSGLKIAPLPITTHAGHACWNLDNNFLDRQNGPTLTSGQYYTHAIWVFWRSNDGGWRTLMRPSTEHTIIIKENAKNLGMYSNRNGGFKDSGYAITNDMSSWQLVVVTGSGSSPTSATGTSTFYTAAEGQSTMTNRGTVDSVASGSTWWRLGFDGQGPGKVAAAYEWNRILSATELNQLLQAGVETSVYQAQKACVQWDALPQSQVYLFSSVEECQKQAATNGHGFYQYGGGSVGPGISCATSSSCQSPVADNSFTSHQQDPCFQPLGQGACGSVSSFYRTYGAVLNIGGVTDLWPPNSPETLASCMELCHSDTTCKGIVYDSDFQAPQSCPTSYELIGTTCFSVVRKARDFANGADSCQPVEDICAGEGAWVANKRQTEAWVHNGGDKLGMPFGLTSTKDNDNYWYDGFGWWQSNCNDPNVFFVCAVEGLWDGLSNWTEWGRWCPSNYGDIIRPEIALVKACNVDSNCAGIWWVDGWNGGKKCSDTTFWGTGYKDQKCASKQTLPCGREVWMCGSCGGNSEKHVGTNCADAANAAKPECLGICSGQQWYRCRGPCADKEILPARTCALFSNQCEVPLQNYGDSETRFSYANTCAAGSTVWTELGSGCCNTSSINYRVYDSLGFSIGACKSKCISDYGALCAFIQTRSDTGQCDIYVQPADCNTPNVSFCSSDASSYIVSRHAQAYNMATLPSVRTALNVGSCPTGTWKIYSSVACQLAARSHNLHYMGASQFQFHPGGCGVDADDQVTHNFGAGSANPQEALICATVETCGTFQCTTFNDPFDEHRPYSDLLLNPDRNRCCRTVDAEESCFVNKRCRALLAGQLSDMELCKCEINDRTKNVVKCRLWYSCMHEQPLRAKIWFRTLLAVAVKTKAQSASFIQFDEKLSSCTDPSDVDMIKALQCPCVAALADECQEAPDRQECAVRFACNRSEVCESWKTNNCNTVGMPSFLQGFSGTSAEVEKGDDELLPFPPGDPDDRKEFLRMARRLTEDDVDYTERYDRYLADSHGEDNDWRSKKNDLGSAAMSLLYEKANSEMQNDEKSLDESVVRKNGGGICR